MEYQTWEVIILMLLDFETRNTGVGDIYAKYMAQGHIQDVLHGHTYRPGVTNQQNMLTSMRTQ